MRGVFSSKRNFLFDLDGTLVDSTAVHARAYLDALTETHPDLARDFDYVPYAGQPTRQVFAALGLGGDELDKTTARKQELYRSSIDRGEVQIFAGAAELLRQLRESGRNLYVVTGASRISAERILGTTHMAKYFSGLVAAEDTRDGKPSPAPYLHALRAYALAPAESLAVEDGKNGFLSAQAARLDVALIHTDLEVQGVIRARDFKELSSLVS